MRQSKLNPNNEKIKDEYERYLKHLRNVKLADDTIQQKITSIRMYEERTKYKDFKEYNAETGIDVYEWLKDSDARSIGTALKHADNIREFLDWYFSNHKVPHKKQQQALSALSAREEDRRLANRQTYVEFPTQEEFDKLIDFEENTPEDKRDKALIVFMLISCARIGAIVTSKISSLDLKKMVYRQDPLEDVATKRSKYIVTKLFMFKKEYFDIIKNWVNYLKTEYHFSDNNPLFPSIKHYAGGISVEKKFVLTENSVNKMLEKRCNHAGIPKYHPHSFRHFGIGCTLEQVSNGLQFKAVSQNIGHENISTTLEKYANMPVDSYITIIEDMFEHNHGYSESLKNIPIEALIAEIQKRSKSGEGFK